MILFIVALMLTASRDEAAAQLTYTFSDYASLLAAQKQGAFNASAPIVVILNPGTYFLSEVIAFTAPSLEFRGLAAELVCDGSGSALQLNVPGSVMLLGLSISYCGGGSPALMIDTASNVTLDGLSFRSNSAGALSIVSDRASDITLSSCIFDSNSLSSAMAINTHAAFISMSQGTLTMQLVTFSGNGIRSSEANDASVMLITCHGVQASSCLLFASNSTWRGNAAGSISPVANIQVPLSVHSLEGPRVSSESQYIHHHILYTII
jgi:hypothetical protein